MDYLELRFTLITVFGLPNTSDDRMIIAKATELQKRHTGHDVAMHSAVPPKAAGAAGQPTMVQAAEMAAKAQVYQSEMAARGVKIGWPEVVRAVQEGRTLQLA